MGKFTKKKGPNFWKKPEKSMGPMPKIGLRKLRRMFVSKRQTSIDKNKDCVMNSARSALVRGSNPPQGHRLHTMTSVMWGELTRRIIKIQMAARVHKTEDKTSHPSVSNGKKRFFFQAWEDTAGHRRQALAP